MNAFVCIFLKRMGVKKMLVNEAHIFMILILCYFHMITSRQQLRLQISNDMRAAIQCLSTCHLRAIGVVF